MAGGPYRLESIGIQKLMSSALQYSKYEDARTYKTIICNNINSLYLACAEQEMSIRGEYCKEFIGLFDPKLIHSVSKQFENDVLKFCFSWYKNKKQCLYYRQNIQVPDTGSLKIAIFLPRRKTKKIACFSSHILVRISY